MPSSIGLVHARLTYKFFTEIIENTGDNSYIQESSFHLAPMGLDGCQIIKYFRLSDYLYFAGNILLFLSENVDLSVIFISS
jgi:hypothetical protein